MPLLTTPTADIAVTYTWDPTQNGFVIDMPLTPWGDLPLVAGPSRLQQDVTRWLQAPQGSDPTNPTFGNPLFALPGRPMSGNPAVTIASMVTQAEAYFLASQQAAAMAGFVSTDEQVDHFGPSFVTPIGAGGVPYDPVARGAVPTSYLVAFLIYTRAQTTLQLAANLPVTT